MPKSPCILAIETATGPCSVAMWKEGGIKAYLEHTGASMQSAILFPLIERVLSQSGTTYKDLTGVACTVGPGSFTGIRVGLAAARGICFAGKLPGLGFTTLEVLAFAAQKQAEKDASILAILNAGKGEWYFQGFKQQKPLFAPRVGALHEAKASIDDVPLMAGSALALGLHDSGAELRADALAELAALHAESAQALVPFYIRPPDAKPQAKRA